MPFLSKINLPIIEIDSYPFNIPSFKNGIQLNLLNNVTFFVGENGSGKSTLLEAVAEKIGFSLRGGNRNHNLNTGIILMLILGFYLIKIKNILTFLSPQTFQKQPLYTAHLTIYRLNFNPPFSSSVYKSF